MSQTALATTKELDDSIVERVSNDLRLATFVGAEMDGDNVEDALPDYSQHGTLVDVEDELPLTEAIQVLDDAKNRKLTFSSLDSVGAETDIIENPTGVRFSSGFSLSADGTVIVVAANSGGLSWHPLDTPITLVAGPSNPAKRLSFSVNLGSQYPDATDVYGVFRVVTHAIGGYYIWMDLVIAQERVARTMHYAIHAEDYVSRPIRMTGSLLTGYFDLRYAGAGLYGVGPGVTLGPGENAVNNAYVSYANTKTISIKLLGFYY